MNFRKAVNYIRGQKWSKLLRNRYLFDKAQVPFWILKLWKFSVRGLLAYLLKKIVIRTLTLSIKTFTMSQQVACSCRPSVFFKVPKFPIIYFYLENIQ